MRREDGRRGSLLSKSSYRIIPRNERHWREDGFALLIGISRSNGKELARFAAEHEGYRLFGAPLVNGASIMG